MSDTMEGVAPTSVLDPGQTVECISYLVIHLVADFALRPIDETHHQMDTAVDFRLLPCITSMAK
jgi:hypothetical protein